MMTIAPVHFSLLSPVRPSFTPAASPSLDTYTPAHDAGIPDRKAYLAAFQDQSVKLKVGKSDENNGAAAGSEQLAQEMGSTEAQLREYYTRKADHHELIAGRKYGQAAAAYRQDLARLPEGDARRELLEKRAEQLEYAEHLQAGGAKVSFPPTLAEVKSHFKGLKKKKTLEVNQEFEKYVQTFYRHVQKDDPKADIVSDEERGAIAGEKGTFVTNTPEDFADVTDKRGLHGSGRRLIDCEGYAWLGEQLYTAAGFRQPGMGGYQVMKNGLEGHVMLLMERGNESVWVSNSRTYTNAGQAMGSAAEALGLPSLNGSHFYWGQTEKEAVVHADRDTETHKARIQVGR